MTTSSTNQTNNSISHLDVAAEVEFIFGAPKVKKDRDREVISDRFGLSGAKPKTLEEIGGTLGITRERVRQIEKNTLRKLTEFLANDLRGQEISSVIMGIINKNGHILRTTRLDTLVLGENSSAKAKHQLTFIAAACAEIYVLTDATNVYRSYFTDPLTSQIIERIIKDTIAHLKVENKPVEEHVLVKKIREDLKTIEAETIVATIATCKTVLKTDSGHLGLSHWRDINPRSIKDKTYYILKKHNQPLHYTEISKHIQNFGGVEKSVTRQAVHNELIRDERFVLIGRGIYALSEWGYTSGVVEDVIEAVLIETGRPMHKDDIIAEVLKRRIVKETTILLNLQKDRFKRVARATYTISK